MLLSIPFALADNNIPLGKWQTTTGESRYEISKCQNGKAICAKLVWLRPDVRTPENLKQLNRIVLSGAKLVSKNKWRGAVKYAGESLSGSLVLLNKNKLRLNGCSFIFCKTVNFKRL